MEILGLLIDKLFIMFLFMLIGVILFQKTLLPRQAVKASPTY